MNLSNLDKRLTALESNAPEGMTWEKFCEALEHDIESSHRLYVRIKDCSIKEDNMSLAEICAAKIDWSNAWDPIRVMLAVRTLQKNNPDAGYVDLKDKLIEWLDNRGESTMANLTAGPV